MEDVVEKSKTKNIPTIPKENEIQRVKVNNKFKIINNNKNNKNKK